jgi:energy-converting hydrogenase Eha subunit C
LPTRRIVVGYYTVAILFGLIAVLVASPLLKIVMLGALGLGVVALLLRLNQGVDNG